MQTYTSSSRMHKRRLYRLPVLLLSMLSFAIPNSAQAQSNRTPAFTLAYFGEFAGHPGFKAGAELPVMGRHRPGKRHGLVLATANLGTYYHKGNHTGIFASSELGVRFITKGGFKLETFLGVGYHRSFIDGPVFRVNDAGVVSRQRFSGQNTLMTSLTFGLGHQQTNGPLAWHIRPGLFIRTPHNSSILPHVFIETGVTYKMDFFR